MITDWFKVWPRLRSNQTWITKLWLAWIKFFYWILSNLDLDSLISLYQQHQVTLFKSEPGGDHAPTKFSISEVKETSQFVSIQSCLVIMADILCIRKLNSSNIQVCLSGSMVTFPDTSISHEIRTWIQIVCSVLCGKMQAIMIKV